MRVIFLLTRARGKRLEKNVIAIAEDIVKGCRVFKYAAADMDAELQPIPVHLVEYINLQPGRETLPQLIEKRRQNEVAFGIGALLDDESLCIGPRNHIGGFRQR